MKFILDCDPGHDDAVALLYAAHHLDLIGITTVFGNSGVDNTTRNALALVDAAGLGIPVAKGAAAPLRGDYRNGSDIHGKTGLDGANLPAPTSQPIDKDAVDFIIEQAHQFPNELVLLAVAPLTNIAIAIQKEARLNELVRAISIMGGSTFPGNMTSVAEFNVFSDPEAASVVFESGIPIRMVGLNVTLGVGFTDIHITRLKRHPATVTKEVGGALEFYWQRQQAVYGRPLAPMHDVCAVIPFVHEAWIEYQATYVSIELVGEFTRGMTVCDLRGILPGDTGSIEPRQEPNARVAVSAQNDKIVADVVDTLCKYH